MIMSIYTNLMLLVWITLQMLINIPSIQNSKNISNEAQKFWYKTWFPWKSNHPNLYTNRNGSLACLSNLFSKVQHDPAFFKIEEQLVGGVFKNAPATMTWKEFYISYRPVVISQNNQASKCLYCISETNKNSWFTNKCLEVRSWSIIAKQFLKCTNKMLVETIFYN